MERADFLDLIDEQGKMIFHGFEKLDKDHPYLHLRKTKKGYHLCIKYGAGANEEIEFIQIWGEPYQKLETRFYQIGKCFDFSDEAKNKIIDLLKTNVIRFEDTRGNYRNQRLLFCKLPTSFREKDAKDLTDNIVKAAEIIRACPRL